MKFIFTASLPIILIVMVCFTGCYDRSRTMTLESYMTFYYTSRDFQLTSYYDFEENGLLAISLTGSFVTPLSKGKDAILFSELSQKYGDTSYKEVVEVHHIPLPYRNSFSESIANITITCDKDIDDLHPTGSSLNDLFLFFSSSPDQYIQNGYKPLSIDKDEFINNIDNRFKEEVETFFQNTKLSSKPIYGVMSGIDFGQYRLMGNLPNPYYSPVGLFTWVTPPEDMEEYTLKMEIEFVDGVKKSATIDFPVKTE